VTTDATIGRFGFTADIGISSWDRDGDQVKVTGYITNTDTNLLAVCRQQLLGLVDSPDEPVVPVLFATDSTQNGYYSVDGASVPMDVSRYTARSLPFSVDMTRVLNFNSPDIEIRSLGVVRFNVDNWDATNVNPTIALPGDASAATLVGATSTTTYATEVGNVLIYAGGVGDTGLNNARTTYKCAPADYYDGACRVEYKVGSTWYTLIGRQARAAATSVRVNNGLIRIAGLTGGTATDSGLTMDSWVSGSTWGTNAKTVLFRRNAATWVQDGPQSAQVLRNTPEECVVRYAFPAKTTGESSILYVDVRLRRGHRMADVSMSYPGATTVQHLLRSNVAMSNAGTALEAYEATSADSDSQKHMFMARASTTLAASIDVSYDNPSSDVRVFGWGVRNTSGSVWHTANDALQRWYAYVSEFQSVLV
jgi:hypothetical protein